KAPQTGAPAALGTLAAARVSARAARVSRLPIVGPPRNGIPLLRRRRGKGRIPPGAGISLHVPLEERRQRPEDYGHSPPHSDGSRSGDGCRWRNSIRSCDDWTTVMPSGNSRCWPSVTGGLGFRAWSKRTIETLPHRVLNVTGSRFSSA